MLIREIIQPEGSEVNKNVNLGRQPTAHQTEGILRPNRVSGAEAQKSVDLDDEHELLHQLPLRLSLFSHLFRARGRMTYQLI